MPLWVWVVLAIIVLSFVLGWYLLGNAVVNWVGGAATGSPTAAKVISFVAVLAVLGGSYGVVRSIFITNWLSEGLGRTKEDKGVIPYLKHGFYCHEHPDPVQCPTGSITHDPPPPPPPKW